MSFVEALLLSLALCVDTLVVSTTTAFRSKMNYRRGVLMALILGFCQFAFPLIGAIIGDIARSFIEAVDHWVAFGLLAFVGGKMIWDGLRHDEDKGVSDSQKLSVATFFILGIATSIDGLAVGIGLGLNNTFATILWVVATVGIVTFVVALVGLYLGKRDIPVPERTATVVAGLVLIGLGVKILLEHLT